MSTMAVTNDTVRLRLPTKTDTWMLFLFCVFPLHLRAYLAFFYALPSYLLQMDIWDITGVLSYVLLFALIESVLFLAYILFINIALPKRLFRQHFLAQGVLFMAASFIWIIPLHYQQSIVDRLSYNMTMYYSLVSIWLISFLLFIVGFSILLRRNDKLERAIIALGEKTAPLSMIYLALDMLALLVVITRLVV